MKNIEVIFFDLFFTLVVPSYEEVEESNEYYDLCISREEWEGMAEDRELYCERAAGKMTDPNDIIRRILNESGITKAEADIGIIAQKRIKRFERSLSNVDENIMITLERLVKNSKRLCLISNADFIDKAGWTSSPLNKYFEEAIFSCEVGVLKPDKRIYEIALSKMGIDPEKAVFIGDGGSEELRGARSAGIHTILSTHFTKGSFPVKGLEYADFVIDRFEELAEVLQLSRQD